jgi:MFS family permease
MSTGYRRNQGGATDPDMLWYLATAAFAAALILIAAPIIIAGFTLQKILEDRLHWRLRFLIWLPACLAGAAMLYASYHHGLDALALRELTAYVLAMKHYQTDVLRWPLGALWAVTWPVWLRVLPGIGIAGFWFEVASHATTGNTARTLRQEQKRRERRVQRLQQRARKRTSRPAHVPDAVGNMMVVGAPIDDDTQEEA